MGAGRCARIIGVTLIPLALVSMVASIALLFPNGESGYLIDKHISWTAQIQAGLWGSGLLVFVAALHMNAAAAGDGGCCCFCRSARIKMFVSIFYSLLAVGGSLVCFVYSVLGLVEGPLCLFNTTLHNEGQIQLWDYPFCTKSISVENYLHDPSCWKTCEEPMNIVLWNIVFFSSLIAVSSLEALLCSFQILNGCWGCIFGR